MAVAGGDEIEKARNELKDLISQKKFSAPDMLRLAYASQFTIANSPHDDAGPKTTESAKNNHKAEIATVKANHSTIMYPDLYQLAGTVALEELGGPILEFVPGRKDSSISPDESCLPDVNVKQSPSDLRGAFAKVKIYDTKHIVALCGGLNLARSGVQYPSLKFDNSYFMELDNKKTSNPSGNALLDDPDFYNCVHWYATHNEDCIEDYKEAHNKLSEFGLPNSAALFRSATQWKNNMVVGQKEKAVGVAVAAIIVILSVFYLINRRRAKHLPQQFQ